MIRKITYLIFVLFCIASINRGVAQNVSDVDVNSLSKSEINDAKKKFQESGLTSEQAAEIARQRGASEQQIEDMQRRLLETNDSVKRVVDPMEEAAKTIMETDSDAVNFHREMHQHKSEIFGSYLFNNENLTFEPSANIQTPSNYELNIGDQVLINIWGNSQSNYQLVVNKNGQVLIPDVGPVYVAGLTFSRAEEKIKNRLISIYADMGGSSPHTFAQINLGQLNAIKVNLVGEVTAPGTYSLPATATVFNALYLSGGPNEIGSFRNINIIRNNKTIKTIDIYDFLINGDPSANINLKDNDVIFVPPAKIRVDLKGFFKRNNIFELKEGETLSDLIRYAGGFTKDAYTGMIKIFRKTQFKQQVIDVPEDMQSSTLLKDGDEVRNTHVLEQFENRITITGSVYRPGPYQWKPGMTLNELIENANGVKDDVFKNKGLITRLNADMTTRTLSFDVQKVLDNEEVIVLEPEDIVSIKSHFDIGENPYVKISGAVMSAGEIPWSEGMTVADVLFIANGFTEAADSSMIEISRRLSYGEAAQLSDTLVHIFTVNQSRHLSDGSAEPFYLEPYDQISVRRAPGYRQQASVSITGEVVYEGDFALRTKTQRISDLIELAHGLTPQAFSQGATLTRRTEELGHENIAIDLQQILKVPKGQADLFLKDGDSIHVPEFTQTVKVEGMVQNPFSLSYQHGKTARFYVNQAGGFGNEALKRKTYVKYANGYTVPTKNFLGIKSYPEVTPGSIVVVPQKTKKEKNTGLWLTVASTMASIAVAIASIVN
jgi:protein involved in polysaccharide export with SLBB domain